MRVLVCAVAAAAVFVVGAAPVVHTQTPAVDARPVLTQYCFTCHNDRLKTGGLSLEALDLAKVGDSPDVWEKVVRRPRAGAMPPPAEQWITSVSAPVK
jgi:mono/diheme cytochrome c family protein